MQRDGVAEDLAPGEGTEEFWRWVEMDRQHLVIKQPSGSEMFILPEAFDGLNDDNKH